MRDVQHARISRQLIMLNVDNAIIATTTPKAVEVQTFTA
nr:MAG TPA: hypothetical protein [Caudoviricetes sp.]